jgi:iron complex transport system substrate-binding protein
MRESVERDAATAAERILAEIEIPRRPCRIACLTEETAETLFRLGAGELVAGVSVYAERPAEVRRKPRISAFIKADFAKIEAVRPDLVLCFSDLQAEIAAECAKRGLDVVVFNQRSIAEILGMVLALGALVGRERAAADLVAELTESVRTVAAQSRELPRRPRVYFEEWDDPLISGIRWVTELITVAGGEDVFPELAGAALARDRIVSAAEVVHRDPECILASWCGKPARLDAIAARPGWSDITAVRRECLHEIPSVIILQPGPAALTDGVRELQRHIRSAALAAQRSPR